MIKQLVLHFLLSLFVVHLVHANNATWVTTAPVVSVNTCTWTPASICTTEFSSLNGVYNSSWTGTISFSDLTPPGGNLLSLKVQLYGAFESGISGVNIPVLINNNNWATWIYLPTYSNDCTTRTDTVTIPGPAAALTQSSNSLTFVIPNNGPQISACGAVISGTYQVASPSRTASISKTPTISVSSSRPQTQSPVTSPSVSSSSTPAATPPGPGSWTSTAPVATQGTCDWTPTSICSTDFFSASGLLGSTNISNSWSGDLYFADLTPNELTLDSLTVQLCGSFEPVTAASISVAINNVPWLTWNSFDSYDFNCTSNTDCVTLTGQPVGPALSQENNNILHFEIASGTPQIFGCGATITGNYSFQGISQSPSNSRTPTQSTTSSTTPSLTQSVGFTQSPSPTQSVGFTHSSSPTQSGISQSPTRSQTLTWTTTAPVETMGTCFWNPGSMCISDFFSANGKYGVNWSGGVYFNDLAAPGTFTTSLSVQIYGSFATVQSNFSIPIYINGQNWTMWEYTNVTYTSNCVDGTDTAIVSANLGGVDLIPTGNFLNISIPDGGPSISACGAVITGVTMVGNASPSVTSSVSASFIPPSNSTSPSLSSSPSITPSQSASEQISWWAVALIIGTVVVILVASIIGTGAAFYHKKSKQLNQYAIMS